MCCAADNHNYMYHICAKRFLDIELAKNLQFYKIRKFLKIIGKYRPTASAL